MKLLTKITTLGCCFSAISALSATYAYAYSEAPAVAKAEETRKGVSWYGGTKEFDFVGNSFFDFSSGDTWL